MWFCALDILPVALLIIILYGIRPVKPFSSFNSEYFSKKTGNYLRGILSLVIIFHHLAQETAAGVLFHGFSRVGSLVVAMFFFISGFGLQKSSMKSENYKKNYLTRRIVPILVPYAIATALFWAFNVLEGRIYSAVDVLKAIAVGEPIVSYSWYIISILVFYVVFLIIIHICGKKYSLIIFFTCIWIVIYTFLCKVLHYGSWWYYSIHLIVVGMLWATFEEQILNFIKAHYKIVTPIILSIFAVLVYLLINGTLAKNIRFSSITTLNIVFCIFCFEYFVNYDEVYNWKSHFVFSWD
ncbi:acyltransferase family protein [Ruminococcus sp.]|uniref:acyltransferase family protein n=1 Tax=Ruminococcus sp. TaxID=41978 RepID=UPI0025F46B67|nr:acyltransferase family protein [Ruminococcus sp.]MBR1431520.1 acyltransferase family protein [Ruminococcus sp.]